MESSDMPVAPDVGPVDATSVIVEGTTEAETITIPTATAAFQTLPPADIGVAVRVLAPVEPEAVHTTGNLGLSHEWVWVWVWVVEVWAHPSTKVGTGCEVEENAYANLPQCNTYRRPCVRS